jgi:hypothetical protein
MSPERPAPHGIAASRWGTIGDLATSAFVLAALTGVALAVPFDAADAYASIAAMLIANPAAAFLRSVHYWASQLFLVLTLLHVGEHLRARTEARATRAMWARLTATVPLAFFLMLSGFILRGDAEGRQALRILTEATSQIPVVGSSIAAFVFGTPERIDLVYLHHAATATIAVWLFTIEHARRVWPQLRSLVAVTALTTAWALLLAPGLHDGLDPIVKGPWYFLGLQEILHWTPWPLAVVAGGALACGLFFAVCLMPPRRAARTKVALLVLSVGYGLLCVVGLALRGESWAWAPHWPLDGSGLKAGLACARPSVDIATVPVPLPVAGGRSEGCLVCHCGVTGLGNSHRPDAVGCAACHGGDSFTLNKARAHAGMILVPGDLASARRACGQAACHPSIVVRVEQSIMTTMSGIVAVDRLVFGEPESPDGARPDVRRLRRTAADTHLRQLCASCHLGAVKTAFGPNGESSRGGGCAACHLAYTPEALDALRTYERRKAAGQADAPAIHPALSLDIANSQCFGCHSRSGRISTSYEGWHERAEAEADAASPVAAAPSRLRRLGDGRRFERVLPDIHQQRGMDCVDCHTASEVMGDGVAHARKRDQVRVGCEDCHADPGKSLATIAGHDLDPESRRVLALRGWPASPDTRYARAASGEALVNVTVAPDGTALLVRKRTGERRASRAAAPICREGGGHARLSCGSCHTAWAPRCPTCHTSFDRAAAGYDWVDDAETTGAWQERGGEFRADPPALSVRIVTMPSGAAREVVETFVPGMILTIDPKGAGPGGGAVTRRLYSRIEPHTTRREARSCSSCHNDPAALGYGRGTLHYEIRGGVGRWRFVPAAATTAEDGLPADAWIGFLRARTGMVSTRSDVRPFTVEEQRRILRVGACLTCHAGDSPVMRQSVGRFDALMSRRGPRCVLPTFE